MRASIRSVLLVLALALPLAAASAQDLLRTPAGSRIRLGLGTPVPAGARPASTQMLVGTLTSVSGDSVMLAVADQQPALRIPMSTIRSAWTSEGRAGIWSTALSGAAKPALGGAAFGAIRASINRRESDPSVLATALSDAALGAVSGALQAVWRRTDRWRSLPLRSDSACAQGARPCGS